MQDRSSFHRKRKIQWIYCICTKRTLKLVYMWLKVGLCATTFSYVTHAISSHCIDKLDESMKTGWFPSFRSRKCDLKTISDKKTKTYICFFIVLNKNVWMFHKRWPRRFFSSLMKQMKSEKINHSTTPERFL